MKFLNVKPGRCGLGSNGRGLLTMKHTYYEVCPECGASLDPGEKCDCKEASFFPVKRRKGGTFNCIKTRTEQFTTKKAANGKRTNTGSASAKSEILLNTK